MLELQNNFICSCPGVQDSADFFKRLSQWATWEPCCERMVIVFVFECHQVRFSVVETGGIAFRQKEIKQGLSKWCPRFWASRSPFGSGSTESTTSFIYTVYTFFLEDKILNRTSIEQAIFHRAASMMGLLACLWVVPWRSSFFCSKYKDTRQAHLMEKQQ